jgi:hypothetical protein
LLAARTAAPRTSSLLEMPMRNRESQYSIQVVAVGDGAGGGEPGEHVGRGAERIADKPLLR